MKFYQKWWFWTLLALFILINLFVSRHQDIPSTPHPVPSERIGTH